MSANWKGSGHEGQALWQTGDGAAAQGTRFRRWQSLNRINQSREERLPLRAALTGGHRDAPAANRDDKDHGIPLRMQVFLRFARAALPFHFAPHVLNLTAQFHHAVTVPSTRRQDQ